MSRRSLAKLLVIAVIPLLLGVSGGTPSTPSYRFSREAGPYVDTIVGWMLENTAGKAREAATQPSATPEEDQAYFQLVGRLLRLSYSMGSIATGETGKVAATASDVAALQSQVEALRPEVERSIQQQIGAALDAAGLGHSLGNAGLLFPPVLFRFTSPPYLLVVSPRDKIEQLTTVLLRSDMTLAEAEQLEDTISRQGYSALVVEIGGLGVYPSMVPESPDIQWTLRTVAHEWSHQFLAFRPLGWRYAFGAERNSSMVSINETAADIIGREIGDEVFHQYYQEPGQQLPPSSPQGEEFRKEMRDIRTRVDALLAQGRVDEAESYMESAREGLARQGYLIRKLNQAYFAFYGSYSDQLSLGGAQGDDVGSRLHLLRDRSASLGDFVWKVSSLTSYDDLRRLTSTP